MGTEYFYAKYLHAANNYRDMCENSRTEGRELAFRTELTPTPPPKEDDREPQYHDGDPEPADRGHASGGGILGEKIHEGLRELGRHRRREESLSEKERGHAARLPEPRTVGVIPHRSRATPGCCTAIVG